jgi:adenine-specific DNA-methyltransferase
MLTETSILTELKPIHRISVLEPEKIKSEIDFPAQAKKYPVFRYMGSKNRLLPWIHDVLNSLDFESAADPFLGSGCVSYLLKSMGKRVMGSDFLNFPAVIAKASVENDNVIVDDKALKTLLSKRVKTPTFIQTTFDGIFFSAEDRLFLDQISDNIPRLKNEYQQAIAQAALIRSCLKKQPRGVFTVSGDLSRYDDGRRDMNLSIEQHFLEQVQIFNGIVFDNGKRHLICHSDVFALPPQDADLVYFDPPYVPRSDDNCYVKRYHFLEGLSCYWKGLEIMKETKVKKINKIFTPFSYRRTAIEAFDSLFQRFQKSIIVLSYSSNGYPDLGELESLMHKYKRNVTTHQKPHRYHFGTHKGAARTVVNEYLIVGL